MSPTTNLRDTRIEFTYVVENAEPLRLPYRSVQFRPQVAKAILLNGKCMGVELNGPNVKKDGSDGSNHHDSYYSTSYRDEQPDWVRSLADAAERRYAAMAEAVAS